MFAGLHKDFGITISTSIRRRLSSFTDAASTTNVHYCCDTLYRQSGAGLEVTSHNPFANTNANYKEWHYRMTRTLSLRFKVSPFCMATFQIGKIYYILQKRSGLSARNLGSSPKAAQLQGYDHTATSHQSERKINNNIANSSPKYYSLWISPTRPIAIRAYS